MQIRNDSFGYRLSLEKSYYKIMDSLTDSLAKTQDHRFNTRHTANYMTEQKLMRHFENINQNSLPKQELANYEQAFTSVIDNYTKKNSPIEAIIQHSENIINQIHQKTNFVQQPVLPNLHPSLTHSLHRINQDFQGHSFTVQPHPILDLENYSLMLLSIGRKTKIEEIQSNAKGKHVIREPSPPPTPSVQQEIQVDTLELQSVQKTSPKGPHRVDLILMDIMREKKRKNFAKDYFTIMEMKLIDLLDYILEDEIGYSGLDATSRTKSVLKNLQSFQGKMIDGESKINLLRIFFEEFTALKKEKEEQTRLATPARVNVRNKNDSVRGRKVMATGGKTTTGRKKERVHWSEQEWIGSAG